MKKSLAIELEFDIKTTRRAIAFVTGEVMSDEEITAKFFDREPVKVDLGTMINPTELFQMCAAFVSIIAADGEAKNKTPDAV